MARALRHPGLVLGAAITGLLAGLALLGLVWTPWPIEGAGVRIADRFQGPSSAHWLGTDRLGRDLLSMLMAGAWTSISIGAAAVAIGLAGGVPLGLAAATAGGWIDEVIGRIMDLTFAFPALLTAVLIAAIWGPGAVNVIVAIGLFNVAVFARVTRGAAQQIQRREFVRAALALGRTRLDAARRHVLPNAAGVLIVQATVQYAVAILAEAGLSYLGLGVPPPQPSWGRMLNEVQTIMYLHPGQAVIPGLAIVLAVIGLNLLGDGLRDLLDPRLRVLRAG